MHIKILSTVLLHQIILVEFRNMALCEYYGGTTKNCFSTTPTHSSRKGIQGKKIKLASAVGITFSPAFLVLIAHHLRFLTVNLSPLLLESNRVFATNFGKSRVFCKRLFLLLAFPQ